MGIIVNQSKTKQNKTIQKTNKEKMNPSFQPGPYQNLSVPPPMMAPGQQQHTLYVGSLDQAVTENVLFEYFSKFGRITNFKIMRDKVKGESRGFAFVDYHTARDADTARNQLNNERIMNKYIRVMWKGDHKKSDTKANVFVRNLDPKLNQQTIESYFMRFGSILSCHLSVNSKGESNCYAHIQFHEVEDAEKCLKNPEQPIGEKTAIVEKFKTKEERENLRIINQRNLYIKNLPADITEDKLIAFFGTLDAEVDKMALRRSESHNAFFCLCAFKTHETAERVLSAIRDGANLAGYDQKLYIDWNKTKAQLAEERSKIAEVERESMLYFRNLKDTLNQNDLEETLRNHAQVSWSFLKPFDATEGPHSQVSYKTQFALVKMKDKEAAEEILRNKNSADIKALFIEKKPVFIDIAMPKSHREKMKAIQNRRYPFAFPFPMMNQRGGAPFPLQYPGFGPMQFPGFPPQFQMSRMPHNGMAPFPRPGRGPQGQRPPRQHQTAPRGGYRGGNGQHPGHGHQQHQVQHAQQAPAPQAPQMKQTAPPPPPPQQQQTQTKKKLDLDTVKANWQNFKALQPDQKRNVLGEFLYPKVEDKVGRQLAPKITGMLVDFEVMTEEEIMQAIEEEQVLEQRIQEAKEALEEVD
eukprot:TRINITY_DN549_c0_g1_i1.p1 TRINITY_DN549_c0_g1~~TRINITY_DN549_c0_g1_i1.p1  ORF type:complete len:638 (+),score=227.91 TRINITY_DN549_c0_g1_i1:105-2018(+)